MFLQSIALLAREHGLHGVPEAWAVWTPTIVEILGIPEQEMLFCGMGIGWEDPARARRSAHRQSRTRRACQLSRV